MFSSLKSTAALATFAVAALSGNAQAQTFPNCGTSIRKAWEDLTCEERTAYLDAVQLLKGSGRYDDFVTMHFDNNELAHGTDTFLPWHRWFLWVFEEELQTISQSCVTIPYWNWEATFNQVQAQAPFASGPDLAYTCSGVWANSANAWACTNPQFNTDAFGNTADQMCCGCGGGDRSGPVCVDLLSGPVETQNVFVPNAHIFREDYFGTLTTAGQQQCVTNGVAANWVTAQSNGATCLLRSYEPGQEPPHDEVDMLNRIVNNPTYEEFRPLLEFGPHGAPHIWIGTNMANHYSPDDPLFWLHHCNVDRIWALWQDYHDHDLVSNANAGTAQYSGIGNRNNPNPIDSPMPFVNPGVLNFNAPGRTSAPTPRDMHASFGGEFISVTYGADQLARTIQTQYNANADWVEPAAVDNSDSLSADGTCVSGQVVVVNPCDDWLCLNNGQCFVNTEGNAQCDCPANFEGQACEIETCQPGICNSGSCDDLPSGYSCDCSNTGFEGPNCETEINECEGVDCGPNGSCVDQVNGFVCECQAGWTGANCETNVDDCPAAACNNVGVCIDGLDSYTCDCEGTGWTGDNCEIDIDECAANPCDNGSVCVNLQNSFSCDCTGLDFTGPTCSTPIDQCENNDLCLNGSVCVDGVNTFSCDCAAGFEGQFCEINIDDCAPNPCQNGGVCSDGVNSFTCDCDGTGFEGATCQDNVDDCAGVDCGANGVCTDLVNGFQCACQIGFEGPNCETNTDDCAGVDCGNGSCVDQVNGFVCECQAGWTGANCETNVDNCPAAACNNVGVCIDGLDSYTCDCQGTGWTGDNCEFNVNACSVTSCANGGICNDLEPADEFWCDCDGTGFTGATCETPVPSAPTQFDRTTAAGEQAMHNAAITLWNNILSCSSPPAIGVWPDHDGSNCQQIWDFWRLCRNTINADDTVTPSVNANHPLCIQWSATVTQLANDNNLTILRATRAAHVLSQANAHAGAGLHLEDIANASSTVLPTSLPEDLAQAPEFRSKFLRRDFAHLAEDYPWLTFGQTLDIIARAECAQRKQDLGEAAMRWIEMMGMEDSLDLFRC